MWRLFDKIRRTPIETIPFAEPPPARPGARGLPLLDPGACGGCLECVARCPTEALSYADRVWSLDLRRCQFCGLCAEVCPNEAITESGVYALATKDPAHLIISLATTGHCKEAG